METLFKVTKKIQSFMNGIIGAMLIVMVAVICLQTLGRGIALSIPWSEELSRYLFCCIIILGINVGIGDDSFVRMDLIDSKLSPRAGFAFLMLRDAVMIAVCALTFYHSFSLIAVGVMRKSPSMQLPMNYLYLMVTIGFGIALFCAVVKTIEDITKQVKKEGAK